MKAFTGWLSHRFKAMVISLSKDCAFLILKLISKTGVTASWASYESFWLSLTSSYPAAVC